MEIIIPTGDATGSDWIQFHKDLRGKFGKLNANIIWLKAWETRGDETFTMDSDFNEYFAKYDIDVSNMATSLIASISNIGNDLFGIVGTAATVWKVGIIVIPVGLLIPIFILLFRFSKSITPTDITNVLAAKGGIPVQL